MVDPGAPSAHRYVSDGQMASRVDRDAMARLNRPLFWTALALIGFAFGFYGSFDGNRDSLPYYRGEVVRIALVWGLVSASMLVIAGFTGLGLGRVSNRRRMRRLYPSGSVTEARLEPDALVLTRPARTRKIPYGRIRRIRAREHVQWLVVRGRPMVEVLPPGFLPPEALETVRARASGAVPRSWSPPMTGPTRHMIVPDGWAAHVAVLTLWEIVGTAKFWARLALSIVVSAWIAYLGGTAWIGLGPGVALVSLAAAYVRTRRAIATAQPSGSHASVELLDDRLVSRTERWARDIRFDEVSAIDVRSDVVFLTMTSVPPRLALARDLVTDPVIERLRTGTKST